MQNNPLAVSFAMNIRIALEWDEQSGIKIRDLDPLLDGIEDQFKSRDYGTIYLQDWHCDVMFGKRY